MMRLVDLQDQEEGFAIWNDETRRFVEVGGNQAWDTFDALLKDTDKRILGELGTLLPNWMREVE